MSDIFHIKIGSDYWSVNLPAGEIEKCRWGPWSKRRLIDLTIGEDYSAQKQAIDEDTTLKPHEKRAAKRELKIHDAIHQHNFYQILSSENGITKKREEDELLSESAQKVAETVRHYSKQFFQNVARILESQPELKAKESHFLSSRHKEEAQEALEEETLKRKRALLLFTKRLIRPKTAFGKNLKKAFHRDAESVAKDYLQETVRELDKEHVYIRLGDGYYVYDSQTRALGPFRQWEDRPFFEDGDVNLVDLNQDEDHKTHLCVLTKFFERQRGEKFYVQSQNEELTTIKNRFERKLFYNSQKEQEQKIKEAATRAFSALEETLGQMELEGKKKEGVQKLLRFKIQENSPLFRLKQSLFCRGDAIRHCGAIESYLEQEVVQKRDRFMQSAFAMNQEFESEQEFKDAKIAARHAFQAFLVAELKFALTLGVNLERVKSGGSGGARFGYDRFGNKIAVVKPENEGPYGELNPNRGLITWFKRLWGKRACIKLNKESPTETGACLVDMQMDMGLVPPTSTDWVNSTSFIKFDRKECSVQAFVAGAKEFEDIVKEPNWHLPSSTLAWMKLRKEEVETAYVEGKEENYVFSDRERMELEGLSFLHGKQTLEEGLTAGGYRKACEDFRRKIEYLGIYDFLIGDTDCHFGNFMLIQKRVEDPVIRDLFNPKKVVPKEKIEHLVNHLFTSSPADGTPSLFAQVMHAFFDGEDGETIVIKHDGGSALPHKHPKHHWLLRGFEMRNSYKFADLPFMEEEFSPEAKAFIEKNDESIAETMLVLGAQNLLGICSKEEFPAFWAQEENRILYKRWLLMGEKADEYAIKAALLKTHQTQIDQSNKDLEEAKAWYLEEAGKETRDPHAFRRAEYAYHTAYSKSKELKEYCDWRRGIIDDHVPRILGIVDTLRQRWELLLAHITASTSDKSDTVHLDKQEAQTFFNDKSQRRLFGYKLEHHIKPAQKMVDQIPEKVKRLKRFRATLSQIAQQRVSSDAFRVPEDFDFHDMQKWTSKLMEDLIPGRGKVRV
jgi:hypothetical protein